MTTITIDHAVVEQALEALEDAKALLNNKDRTTTMWFADEITALRAALAQAEPLNLADPAVRKRLATQWGYVPQQDEPVEPVAWVNQANLDSARIARDRGGQGDTHTWSETRGSYHGVPLYAAPPQRKPLTEEEKRALADKFLSCQPESYEVSGVFDLISAVERAHGIKE